jgi:hypothetical protein
MRGRSINADAVTVRPRYPTAAVFIDESGSRAPANEFFVVAAIKVREPGRPERSGAFESRPGSAVS